MKFTGERFIPQENIGVIEAEHYHRYLHILPLIKNKSVIDIACGEGYGSALMAKHASSVIGIDIAKETVQHAKEKYQADNLTFQEGDATNIALGSGMVDVVVSFETIEHHNQHEQMLSSIKEVLKPNGTLIISSPNKEEYTDKRDYHNEFHVKELYTKEFYDLIGKYFCHTYAFKQRVIFGSMLLPVNQTPQSHSFWAKKEDGLYEQGANGLAPMYDLLIASEEPISIPIESSFLYMPHYVERLVEAHKTQERRTYESMTWKLGRMLLAPFQFLKKK